MNCYNCRRTLNKKTISKEHIPAQAFYVGYGNEFKKNRITVSACKICNENYSKTDQELRDSIGVTNDIDPLKKEYTRKSVSSILRKKGKNNDRKKKERERKGNFYFLSIRRKFVQTRIFS